MHTLIGAAKLAGPDYIILGGYFTLMLGVGVYFYRYMKQIKDYFTGGNNIPWWLSGVSFYMASFSVFLFVSMSDIAYKYGMVSITLILLCVWGTLFGTFFFARKWRRARITSPVEYLEQRYSPWVRQLFAWEGLPVRIIDDSLKLVALGKFISVSMGFRLEYAILGSSLITLCYTMSGGLWAVTVTDFIQFVILLTAIAVLVPLSISRAGGFSEMFNGMPDGFFSFTHAPEYDTLYILGGIILYVLSYSSVNWALIQRYYCVPKEKDSIKMGVFVMILFLVCQPLIVLPVMLSRKFMPASETVYVTLCQNLLPAGMMGLIIAAMFAATISTLSGDYNVCSSVFTTDVYRRYIRPQAAQKELVLAGRVTTVCIGLISLGVAYSMIHLTGEGLFKSMMTLFSIFTPPVAVSMISGLLFRKASSKSALCGFGLGVAVGLTLFILSHPDIKVMVFPLNFLGQSWQKETLFLFSTALTTMAGMFIGTRIFRQTAEEDRRVAEFFRRISIPIGQMEEDVVLKRESGTRGISPFRVVGICVSLTSLLLISVVPWIEAGEATHTNLMVAGGLLLAGILMIFFSRKSGAKENPTR